MRIAIYPGSFDPWHVGHEDIVEKALGIFDKVIIVQANNPEKKLDSSRLMKLEDAIFDLGGRVPGGRQRLELKSWDGLIVDFITKWNEDSRGAHWVDPTIHAMIRGLRNGHDLQYEMNQQYWNEDLGLDVPVVYFITDRKYQHISSSAIRSLEKFKH